MFIVFKGKDFKVESQGIGDWSFCQNRSALPKNDWKLTEVFSSSKFWLVCKIDHFGPISVVQPFSAETDYICYFIHAIDI